MEILRETGPLLLGMTLVSSLIGWRLSRYSSTTKRLVTLAICFGIGAVWSLLVGEQNGRDLVDRLTAIVIDASLAFTGATLADWVVWSRKALDRAR